MKTMVLCAGAAVILMTSCSYDPEPVGCSFRVETTGGLRIADQPMSDFSLEDSLPPDSILEIITDSLDSGQCTLEFGVSVFVRNDNSWGKVIIDDFDWTCLVSMDGVLREIDSGEYSYSLRVNPGEPRNILCDISINAAEVLYADYTLDEIMSLCYALGGEYRTKRDDAHLGRVYIQAFVTEETPHGPIDYQGPFMINLDWIKP